MAQNGGGGLRRATTATAAHAPPRPAATGARMAATSPQIAAIAPPTSARSTSDRDFITLAQPRPGMARLRNEYIETPLRPLGPLVGLSGGKGSINTVPLPTTSGFKHDDSRGRISPAAVATSAASSSSLPNVHGGGGGGGGHRHHLLQSHPSSPQHQQQPYHHHHHHHHHRPLNQSQLPILNQPMAATFKKEKAAAAAKEESSHNSESSSIICRECRRCKCDACRNPKPLPSTWICENKYQCSAETTVDYCSCMCCVKGFLYHCMKDYDMDNDVRCADKPCSCHPHRRCTRWGCMVALVPLLPCLLCYWPLKGCLKLCEMCYTKYHSQGCQCRDTPPAAYSAKKEKNLDQLPNKRLLDSNTIEC